MTSHFPLMVHFFSSVLLAEVLDWEIFLQSDGRGISILVESSSPANQVPRTWSGRPFSSSKTIPLVGLEQKTLKEQSLREAEFKPACLLQMGLL